MNLFSGRPEPPAPPLARLGVLLLCALWLAAGVVGHDPWKGEDVLHLDVARNMAAGDWLVPRIAGDPWLVSPPLYHWLAAAAGSLLGGALPWHDAARLATLVFGAGLLLALHGLARRLHGPGAALAAPVLAIGTLGLLVPLHDAQPDGAQLLGLCLALHGLALWLERPLAGGLVLGTGLGLAFLAGGLDSLLLPLAVSLALSPLGPWRRGALVAGPAALFLALVLALPWPWALRQHSPMLFDIWWSAELDSLAVGKLPGRHHLELLAWATWPLLPLALWQLWLERRRPGQARTLLPLAAFLLAIVLFLARPSSLENLLPALVPLALLAAAAAPRLRRGAAAAFDWFGMMTFSLAAGLIWLGGIAMLTGEPARVAKNFSKPAPGFVAHFSTPAILLAVAATVAWIAVMLRTPRSPWRAAARWSVGLTTVWLLLVALWLPWIDYGKSYRSPSAELRQALQAEPGCIARRGLGLAQRASLDYFDGIRTVPLGKAKTCRHLIMQTTRGAARELEGWRLILETSRPGDKNERLRLYRRD